MSQTTEGDWLAAWYCDTRLTESPDPLELSTCLVKLRTCMGKDPDVERLFLHVTELDAKGGKTVSLTSASHALAEALRLVVQRDALPPEAVTPLTHHVVWNCLQDAVSTQGLRALLHQLLPLACPLPVVRLLLRTERPPGHLTRFVLDALRKLPEATAENAKQHDQQDHSCGFVAHREYLLRYALERGAPPAVLRRLMGGPRLDAACVLQACELCLVDEGERHWRHTFSWFMTRPWSASLPQDLAKGVCKHDLLNVCLPRAPWLVEAITVMTRGAFFDVGQVTAAFTRAASEDCDGALEVLWDSFDDLGTRALLDALTCACAYTRTGTVRALTWLLRTADALVRASSHGAFITGRTLRRDQLVLTLADALRRAVERCHSHVVTFLTQRLSRTVLQAMVSRHELITRATELGQLEMVQALLQVDASYDTQSVACAVVRSRNLELLTLFQQRDRDFVHTVLHPSWWPRPDGTMLDLAVVEGEVGMIRALVGAGARLKSLQSTDVPPWAHALLLELVRDRVGRHIRDTLALCTDLATLVALYAIDLAFCLHHLRDEA